MHKISKHYQKIKLHFDGLLNKLDTTEVKISKLETKSQN